MRIACILITHFPIKVELERHQELRNIPVIITTQTKRGTVVLDRSIEASGIVPGMPLQEALSRCKCAAILESDMPYYVKLFNHIVEGLLQVTPAIEKADLGCAYMEIGGLQTMCGGESNIISSLLDIIPEIFNARLGLANIKFHAYIAAVLSNGRKAINASSNIPRFFDALSVNLLPISWENKVRMHRFGIHTFEQLASMPVGPIQAQFGHQGRIAWRLANGMDDSLLVPDRYEQTVSSSLAFPTPTATVHAILAAIRILLSQTFAHPTVKGRHIRTVSIQGQVLNRSTWIKKYTFKEAVNNKENVISVLKSSLETLKLPGALEEITVTLSGITGESGTQSSLFIEVRKHVQLREVMRQLEARLEIKPPIYKVRDIEPWSRLPERRQALVQFEP